MYRIRLDAAARQELHRRTHEPGVMPRTRDRLEMVRLSDAGWSIPKIAQHLQVSEKRVRFWVKAYLSGGLDALPDKPHVGQTSALSSAILEAVRAEVRKGERTWSASQLSEWIVQHHGVHLSGPWLGRLLRRAKLSYKRTSRTLSHKRDPEELAQKSLALQALEKGAMQPP
jgi:transposase